MSTHAMSGGGGLDPRVKRSALLLALLAAAFYLGFIAWTFFRGAG